MVEMDTKPLMIIPDTGVCDLLYQKTKNEYNAYLHKNPYTEKQIECMNKKLLKYYESGVLYITETIKWEFEGRFLCKYRDIIKEFWKMFQSKTLLDSYTDKIQIDEICKNVTESNKNKNKNKIYVKRKIKRNEKKLKNQYEESKKEYDRLCEKWENNESCEEFKRMRKRYFAIKGRYNIAVADQSYLFIEGSDRRIISSAIDSMKKGYDVHIITTDVGLIYMKKSLKKDYSITIDGFQSSNKNYSKNK